MREKEKAMESSSLSRHVELDGVDSKQDDDNVGIAQTNESDEGVIKSMIHDLMKSNYENLLSADRHLLKGKRERGREKFRGVNRVSES